MNRSRADELLTPAEAARLLDLTPAAVVAMATRGALPVTRTASGRRLFWRRDVERVEAERADRPRRGGIAR